jgi:hypothetical protein
MLPILVHPELLEDMFNACRVRRRVDALDGHSVKNITVPIRYCRRCAETATHAIRKMILRKVEISAVPRLTPRTQLTIFRIPKRDPEADEAAAVVGFALFNRQDTTKRSTRAGPYVPIGNTAVSILCRIGQNKSIVRMVRHARPS